MSPDTLQPIWFSFVRTRKLCIPVDSKINSQVRLRTILFASLGRGLTASPPRAAGCCSRYSTTCTSSRNYLRSSTTNKNRFSSAKFERSVVYTTTIISGRYRILTMGGLGDLGSKPPKAGHIIILLIELPIISPILHVFGRGRKVRR